MKYPYMLIMRNSPSGMIWQAYTVNNDEERDILTKNANTNMFFVEKQEVGYTDETSPGWRNDDKWKECVENHRDPEGFYERPKNAHYKALRYIKRDGPYWLSGYQDWLVACFSIRSMDDLHGFIPIACWSELGPQEQDKSKTECKQWMLCVKGHDYFVHKLFGTDYHDYGINPTPVEQSTYPPHIFDWIWKQIDHHRKNINEQTK